MQYEIVIGHMDYAFNLEEDNRYAQGSDEALEAKVNKMISEGWKPLGGVSTAVSVEPESSYVKVMFSQAMIKE